MEKSAVLLVAAVHIKRKRHDDKGVGGGGTAMASAKSSWRDEQVMSRCVGRPPWAMATMVRVQILNFVSGERWSLASGTTGGLVEAVLLGSRRV